MLCCVTLLVSRLSTAGLLIWQYFIGIASIGNTFISIAIVRVLQYFLRASRGKTLG